MDQAVPVASANETIQIRLRVVAPAWRRGGEAAPGPDGAGRALPGGPGGDPAARAAARPARAGPLRLRLPGRPVAVVLSAGDVGRLLEARPSSSRPATRRSMRPWGGSSTARSPRVGAGRAPWNEAVLETHQSLHHLAPALLPGNAGPRAGRPRPSESLRCRRAGASAWPATAAASRARTRAPAAGLHAAVPPRPLAPTPTGSPPTSGSTAPPGTTPRSCPSAAAPPAARAATWRCSAPRVRWRGCCANENGGCPPRARSTPAAAPSRHAGPFRPGVPARAGPPAPARQARDEPRAGASDTRDEGVPHCRAPQDGGAHTSAAPG